MLGQDGGGETHAVSLRWRDGREESLSVGPDETVVDAAGAAGVGLPYGCLYGACGTCTGKLLSGDVEHAAEPRALKPRHRDVGYVLLCLAEPRSACRIEVGARVQADLVPNPWK
ncbi:2Fe-2S iron-sulfur cluster-binding protein [Salinigranum marinum]|uniref:2Fe-2S iron-sulfur cluster-binding protein n=1 Tax=Salinigranum marinum TaxID=1515595 RepID=UPI002989B287|nr:2Fe-2S iron-sulfur cluster-binding protein [Salinigranum marinum]